MTVRVFLSCTATRANVEVHENAQGGALLSHVQSEKTRFGAPALSRMVLLRSPPIDTSHDIYLSSVRGTRAMPLSSSF